MAITYERKKQRQNNILYTIVAAILICAVFFAMVVSFFIKAEDDAYEMLHIQTKQIKDDLTLQLKSDRENLATMAHFAANLYADGEKYDRMFSSFEPIGLFSKIGILNPDGTFITKDGVYDLSGQISFEEQALLGEHVTGRTYSYSMPDEQVVRSSVPIQVNGETVGIMYGIIKIETINEKYKPQVDFEPFVKLVILSNNAETLIKATEWDVRYWIRRLNPLTAEEYIPKFDARLQAETPAVLYTLATRQMATPDQSRMWFSHDAIKTDALAVVVENSLSDLAKTIKEWIAETSASIGGLEFGFSAKDLSVEIRETNLRAISDALRKELKMDYLNTEYKDWNGATKKGRRYLVAGKTTEDIIQEQEDTPF